MFRAFRRSLATAALAGCLLLTATGLARAEESPPPTPAPPAESPMPAMPQPTQPGTAGWEGVSDNLDRAITGLGGVFERLFLTQPSLYDKSEHWVWAGWRVGFGLGLLLVMIAYFVHSHHLMKGTDLLRGQSPWKRLAVPALAMTLMVAAPIAVEWTRAAQEWIWSADGFDRTNASSVLGVALPQVAKPTKPNWWEMAKDLAPKGPLDVIAGPITMPWKIAKVGLVASLGDRVGTGWASINGVVVVVLGMMAFAAYFIRGVLIWLTGFYLGIAAFADRPEPAIGWFDLLIRTALLPSVFNATWWLMRRMPDWFSFLHIDTFFFILFLLVILIPLLWRLWVRRLFDVLTDPLTLGGFQVMAGIAKSVRFLGQAAAVAGTVTGMPALAGAGSAMTQWGGQAYDKASQVTQTVQKGLWWGRGENGSATVAGSSGTESLLRDKMKAKLEPLLQAARAGSSPASGGGGSTPGKTPAGHPPATGSQQPSGPQNLEPCFTDGSQFVTWDSGMWVHHPAQPPNTMIVGPWPGPGTKGMG